MKFNCKNMTITAIYPKPNLQKKYLANCKNSRKFHYIKLQDIQTVLAGFKCFCKQFSDIASNCSIFRGFRCNARNESLPVQS